MIESISTSRSVCKLRGLSLRDLLFWGLIPFVLPQALLVRKNAPRFSAAIGPAEGEVGEITSGVVNKRLLAIGDSIIQGVGVEKLEHALVGQTAKQLAHQLKCRVSWSALGEIGLDAQGIVSNLIPRMQGEAYDYVIVSVGVNDATTLSLKYRWRRQVNRILGALSHHSPNAIVAVAGLPPLKHFPLLPQPLKTLLALRAESLDKCLQAEIRQMNNFCHVPVNIDLNFENFSDDGFHPSGKGYQQFGCAMAEALLSHETMCYQESA